MNRRSYRRWSSIKFFIFLAGFLLVFLGMVFVLPVRLAQAQTGTPTVTMTATANGTPSATTSGTTTVTAAATTSGTTTITPTATMSGTAAAATLPPPAFTGTPTVLVPVTGADLTQPGGGSHTGMWIAIWLLGLLLIWFGLRSRLSKRQP